MPLPSRFSILSGEWRGTKRLYLSGESGPQKISPARLTIAKAARESFMMLAYTWQFESDPHEGILMLGYDDRQNFATAAWGDSWHMNSEIMHCTGDIGGDGVFNVRGAYKAPPGPDWGWRIRLAIRASDAISLSMFNISPDGNEDVAVLAEFNRAE